MSHKQSKIAQNYICTYVHTYESEWNDPIKAEPSRGEDGGVAGGVGAVCQMAKKRPLISKPQ